jgi:hypothetical protein
MRLGEIIGLTKINALGLKQVLEALDPSRQREQSLSLFKL